MWWYYFLMRFDTTQPSFDLPFSQKPASLVVEWAERIRRRPVDKGIWKWKRQSLNCVWLCDPMDYTAHGTLQARIQEWVAFPFSRGSSWPRNRTGVSCIAGGLFTNWAIREAIMEYTMLQLTVLTRIISRSPNVLETESMHWGEQCNSPSKNIINSYEVTMYTVCDQISFTIESENQVRGYTEYPQHIYVKGCVPLVPQSLSSFLGIRMKVGRFSNSPISS